jgi:hypothetical protein
MPHDTADVPAECFTRPGDLVSSVGGRLGTVVAVETDGASVVAWFGGEIARSPLGSVTYLDARDARRALATFAQTINTEES